jgi:hypothetical protein
MTTTIPDNDRVSAQKELLADADAHRVRADVERIDLDIAKRETEIEDLRAKRDRILAER